MKRILLTSLCAALSLSFAPTSSADPQWIWLSKNAANNERVTLKKEFEVAGEIKSATLAVSCDNGAKASLKTCVSPYGAIQCAKTATKT